MQRWVRLGLVPEEKSVEKRGGSENDVRPTEGRKFGPERGVMGEGSLGGKKKRGFVRQPNSRRKKLGNGGTEKGESMPRTKRGWDSGSRKEGNLSEPLNRQAFF